MSSIPEFVRTFTENGTTRYALSIRKPKKRTDKVADFIVDTAFAPLRAWVVMLLLGGVHSAYPAVPALGFWPTFGLLYAFVITVGWSVADGVRSAIQREL